MDFNPRSPRGGATAATFFTGGLTLISIHAPHEGERPSAVAARTSLRGFQSTLPTRGSDGGFLLSEKAAAEFQSTLPTRGSDIAAIDDDAEWEPFQSTLPTRGSDRIPELDALAADNVSIHAPHEGERHGIISHTIKQGRFNPRSPRGGATSSLWQSHAS